MRNGNASISVYPKRFDDFHISKISKTSTEKWIDRVETIAKFRGISINIHELALIGDIVRA